MWYLKPIPTLENQSFETKVQRGNPEIEKALDVNKKLTPELEESEKDQVKIEDQGNFMIHETPRSLSEDHTPNKVEESKQRHLFYMK